MHVMFIHQNFPAQFRYIAPRLVSDLGWQCTFVTGKAEGSLPGIEKIVYRARGGATRANHLCTRNFENCVVHTHGVYAALKARPDIQPDLIIAHTGFGSSLFLPFLYDAPIINFLEYYYRPRGGDMGFRPEMPVTEAMLLRVKTRNAMLMLDLDNCDRGWTPTQYQREFFPAPYRDKIEVIFDGIDTRVYHRKDNPTRSIGGGKCIDPKLRIVTYVARGFEMMRGFDIFMKAAKRIYEQFPDVAFVVVGADGIHYGGEDRYIAGTFRHHILAQDEYDLSKFNFTGYVSQETLADILAISDLHIYLTEPFIASWSLVDAMACGAVVLASDQRCVREYINHGENGLLCDFFDYEALARKAVDVLRDPAAYRHLGEAAQRTVEQKYSLDVAIPRLKAFFERIAAQKRQPSERLATLTQTGTWTPLSAEDDPDLELAEAAAPVASSETARAPQDSPQPDDPNAPPLERALATLRRMPAADGDIVTWVRACQSFRGPAGEFARLGPRNHPTDLARLMQRVCEWKPELVLDLGTREGGTVYLWTRGALNHARIICAALPGVSFSADKVRFLQAMARGKQKIECIHGAEDWGDLRRRIEMACGGKKCDFAFMDGIRPASEVRANFRTFRNRVRKNGLFAWDGVQPATEPNETENGGDRLWSEVKPMFQFHAEYLSGCVDRCGGIVMVRL